MSELPEVDHEHYRWLKEIVNSYNGKTMTVAQVVQATGLDPDSVANAGIDRVHRVYAAHERRPGSSDELDYASGMASAWFDGFLIGVMMGDRRAQPTLGDTQHRRREL